MNAVTPEFEPQVLETSCEWTAADVTELSFALTNSPALFWTAPKAILFCNAYINSTYPIAPGVCPTSAATPSFPLPPTPTGQFTDVLTPTLLFHSGDTFER